MGWDQEDVIQDQLQDQDIEELVKMMRYIGNSNEDDVLRAELDEFLNLDDENSAVYAQELLEDVDNELKDNDVGEEDIQEEIMMNRSMLPN